MNQTCPSCSAGLSYKELRKCSGRKPIICKACNTKIFQFKYFKLYLELSGLLVFGNIIFVFIVLGMGWPAVFLVLYFVFYYFVEYIEAKINKVHIYDELYSHDRQNLYNVISMVSVALSFYGIVNAYKYFQ